MSVSRATYIIISRLNYYSEKINLKNYYIRSVCVYIYNENLYWYKENVKTNLWKTEKSFKGIILKYKELNSRFLYSNCKLKSISYK